MLCIFGVSKCFCTAFAQDSLCDLVRCLSVAAEATYEWRGKPSIPVGDGSPQRGPGRSPGREVWGTKSPRSQKLLEKYVQNLVKSDEKF